jgi:hypothetical protein
MAAAAAAAAAAAVNGSAVERRSEGEERKPRQQSVGEWKLARRPGKGTVVRRRLCRAVQPR